MDRSSKREVDLQSLGIRVLYMLLFAVIYGVAEFVVWALVVVQTVLLAVTGRRNELLLKFGGDLSAFVYALLRFLTFNSDEKPFPFRPWPTAPARLSPHALDDEVARLS